MKTECDFSSKLVVANITFKVIGEDCKIADWVHKASIGDFVENCNPNNPNRGQGHFGRIIGFEADSGIRLRYIHSQEEASCRGSAHSFRLVTQVKKIQETKLASST